jgi:hypothetical protein
MGAFDVECTNGIKPWHLGQFGSNYIIFRNVENFKNYLFQITRL